MKRLLLIEESDFAVLSKFASTGRTFDNAKFLLDKFLGQSDADAGDRASIGLEELGMLHKPVENLNNRAKQLLFSENNLDSPACVQNLQELADEMEDAVKRLRDLTQLPKQIYLHYREKKEVAKFLRLHRDSHRTCTVVLEDRVMERWALVKENWQVVSTEKYTS